MDKGGKRLLDVYGFKYLFNRWLIVRLQMLKIFQIFK
jgi:hypothetical protein